MSEQATLGGSVYIVNERQISQARMYASLDILNEQEQKFISSILALASTKTANASNHFELNRTELQQYLTETNQPASDGIIKKRTANLQKAGIFHVAQIKRTRAKAANSYTLAPLSDLLLIAPPEKKEYPNPSQAHAGLKQLRTQLALLDAQVLDESTVRFARSDKLFIGVLSTCLRSSQHDPRRQEPITTIYRYQKEQVKIVTSTLSDQEIATIEDIRVMRAVFTLVCMEIQERKDSGKPIENSFVLDIVSLLNLLGLSGSGGNRDVIRNSLNRLYATNFRFDINQQQKFGSLFAKSFGLDAVDEMNFKFLTELDSNIDREYDGATYRRPRYFRIAIHSRTYRDLMDAETIASYIDNIEILRASSGFIDLIYNWCSIMVKRSGYKRISTTLKQLHLKLLPATRFDNFSTRFISAIKNHHIHNGGKWSDTSSNLVKLFGYILIVEKDATEGYKFLAYRDKNDPVIGDKSFHIRKLALSGQKPQEEASEHQEEISFE